MIQGLKSILGFRVSSDRADRQFAQYFAFAGAIGVIACLSRVVHRFASSPFEIMMVVLMVLTLSLAMVILGLLLALDDSKFICWPYFFPGAASADLGSFGMNVFIKMVSDRLRRNGPSRTRLYLRTATPHPTPQLDHGRDLLCDLLLRGALGALAARAGFPWLHRATADGNWRAPRRAAAVVCLRGPWNSHVELADIFSPG